MKTSVLLGNGINRCVLKDICCSDMLSQIAKKYNVELNKNISFPMQFETLATQILLKYSDCPDDIYIKLKEEIIALLKEGDMLPENSPHKALTDNSDSIITTNYDFFIEKSIDPDFDETAIPVYSKDSNNKYNLKNSISVFGKKVYHIHGDVRRAQSICLGYEHYAGTLQHLRDAIKTRKKGDEEDAPAIVLKLRHEESQSDVWAEKIFTDNIHIVGFGLSKAEIDIWWLITYRASLFYSNRFNCRNLITNQITYHDIGVKPDENMRFTLENLGVKYAFHEIPEITNDYYLEQYIKISEMIK